MALPDSRMSVVISLSSEIFRKRAEEAIKTSEVINCLGNINPALSNYLIYTHPDPTETFFLKDEESNLYLILGIMINTISAKLQLLLTAEPDEDDLQAFRLVLAYHNVLFDSGLDPLTDEQKTMLDNAATDQLNPILSAFAPSVPLGALLASDVELVDSPLLRIPTVDMTSDVRRSDNTLVIGLEFNTDNGADRDVFMEDFTDNPRGPAEWHLSVDDRLILARVNEVLAGMDFTQDAEDGIEHWLATTETQAYWTGDNVEDELLLSWHEKFVTDNMGNHPIWFKVIGFYDLDEYGLGLATESYALGHADFLVETDDEGIPQITVSARLFAAGTGIMPFEISEEEQPEPTHVAPAEVAPHLSVSEFSYDEEFLACTGTDSHVGLPGNATIQVGDSLSLVLDTSMINPCGGIMSYTQSAHLLGQSTVEAGLLITNTGAVPLWICGITLDDPDGVFELATNAQFPVALPAGENVSLKVHYHSPDTDTHYGHLTITCNDLYDRHFTVALTGRLYGGLHPSVAGGLGCFKKPDYIPPQQWFENLGEMLRDIDPYVDGTITPEHSLNIRVSGMGADTLIQVLDRQGNILDTSFYAESGHHIKVPIASASINVEGKSSTNGAMQMLMAVSKAEVVGHFKADTPLNTFAQDSQHLYAIFSDRVAIISLRDPKTPTEIATVPLEGGVSARLTGEQLVVGTVRELHVFDVSDPYTPTERHRMKATAFDVYDEHLLATDDSSIRIYQMRTGLPPVLQRVLNLPRTPRQLSVNRDGKRLLVTSDAGSYSVRSLLRTDLAHAKSIHSMSGKANNHGWRQFQLEIRPNKRDGGFDVIRQRYGTVSLHNDRIEKLLNRSR